MFWDWFKRAFLLSCVEVLYLSVCLFQNDISVDMQIIFYTNSTIFLIWMAFLYLRPNQQMDQNLKQIIQSYWLYKICMMLAVIILGLLLPSDLPKISIIPIAVVLASNEMMFFVKVNKDISDIPNLCEFV